MEEDGREALLTFMAPEGGGEWRSREGLSSGRFVGELSATYSCCNPAACEIGR